MLGGGERKNLYNCDGKERSNPKKMREFHIAKIVGLTHLKKRRKVTAFVPVVMPTTSIGDPV